MKAYVICMNDSVEFVVIDKLTIAQKKLRKLSNLYYKANKSQWKSKFEYLNICYWHIHTVEAI